MAASKGILDHFPAIDLAFVRRAARRSACCFFLGTAVVWASACAGKAALPGEDAPGLPIRPTASGFADPAGRTVILRGPNVRAPGFFETRPSDTQPAPFEASDCNALARDFGLNVIRLTLSWSLIEPERGQYDEAYLARVRDIVDACGRAGVSTLLDLHQDGYSMYIGVDGAPRWAHADPLPPADLSGGGSGNPLNPTTTAAFAYLFADGSPVGQAFTAMLVTLAARFDDDVNVVGLEILNEPYLMGEPDVLFGFYGRILAALRAHGLQLPVFVEPSADRNIVDVGTLPAQLPFAPTGVVYAPHLYTGVFALPWVLGDRDRLANSVAAMATEAATLGMPLFVGEWGGPDILDMGRPWSDIAVELFDAHQVSWTNWSYDERSAKCAGIGPGYCTAYFQLAPAPDKPGWFVRSGTYQANAVALYARPFPHAVTGVMAKFSYAAATRTLTVTGQFHGSHDLSAPQLVYPKGAQVRCDGAVVTAVNHAGFVRADCTGATLLLEPTP